MCELYRIKPALHLMCQCTNLTFNSRDTGERAAARTASCANCSVHALYERLEWKHFLKLHKTAAHRVSHRIHNLTCCWWCMQQWSDGLGSILTDAVECKPVMRVVSGRMMCVVDSCNEATQFHCALGTTCISSSQQCDGVAQCSDTSDEADCCELWCHEITLLLPIYHFRTVNKHELF